MCVNKDNRICMVRSEVFLWQEYRVVTVLYQRCGLILNIQFLDRR